MSNPYDHEVTADTANTPINLRGRSLNHVHVTLESDTEIDLQNIRDGAFVFLNIRQDGVGGHALTWKAGQIFLETPAPVLTTAANAKDTFILCGKSNKLFQHGFAKDVK